MNIWSFSNSNSPVLNPDEKELFIQFFLKFLIAKLTKFCFSCIKPNNKLCEGVTSEYTKLFIKDTSVSCLMLENKTLDLAVFCFLLAIVFLCYFLIRF